MSNQIGLGAATLLCWLTYNFVGTPILQFLSLRTEIRRNMLLFANVRARQLRMREPIEDVLEDQVLTDKEESRLREAEDLFRSLASQLMAFADTQALTCWFLHFFGFEARAASSALFGLSNSIGTYGSERANHIASLEKSLRFSK